MPEYQDFSLASLVAAEAATTGESMSANPNTAMAVTLITDKIIERSNLKPVSDPISFSAGSVPTPKGLFSEEIFGYTNEEKMRQFAYIDLHTKVFHPFVYEILKALMPRKFDKCAAGQGKWMIITGDLVELQPDDPSYAKGGSGINFLIDNFDSFHFSQSGALMREERIKLINKLSKDELFISKWLVIPIGYRDLDKNSSVRKLPEIDNRYNNLIRYANSLRNETFSLFANTTKYNMQQELVEIRKYGQTLLEKKTGFIHKSILGKSVDRGSRDVISAPTLVGKQKPSDCLVDIDHSGIPLAKCLIIGYDFVLRWVQQFFGNNFRNLKEYPVYEKQRDGSYKVAGSVKIKDQLLRFTAKYIEKKINRFKDSHGTRFELVTVETEDGYEIPVFMHGLLSPLDKSKPGASTIADRPLTWTDLFYMAAVETCEDKYVYITRYPITSHSSIFPSLCRVMSTIQTIPATVAGKFYPYYPIIDLSTPTDRISNLFIDTVTMSNMYLEALGGDYDGDTISVRLCFTIEANEEARQIAESVRNYVSVDGSLLRVLGKECYLSYYNMTRANPVQGMLSKELKKELLALKPEDLTLESVSELFGYTTDSSGKDKKNAFNVKPPKFHPRATFTLNAGEYSNTTTIKTTVGRFLFNKLLIEGRLEHVVPDGYYNEDVNKKKLDALSNMVAKALLTGQIKVRPTVIDFLNAEEFWGLGLVTVFSPSYSLDMMLPNERIEAKKKELLANAKDNSLSTLADIEKELVEFADKETTGMDGKYLFDSGARGSFSNDYKNMMVSIGLVENPQTKSYDFMKSSYIQGIAKEDIPAASNTVLNAEYPKAIGTAQGGYMTKQFYAVYQSMSLDVPGSDCGSKRGIATVITKDNLNDYEGQYIIDGTKTVLVDDKLPTKYMNHPVEVRSPMYCCGEKFCSKCMGLKFYQLGLTDAGLTSTALTGSLQNASLKARHDLSVKMNTVNIDTLLI